MIIQHIQISAHNLLWVIIFNEAQVQLKCSRLAWLQILGDISHFISLYFDKLANKESKGIFCGLILLGEN